MYSEIITKSVYVEYTLAGHNARCSRRWLTSPLLPPSGELDETYIFALIPAQSLHYVKTCRHPQNQTYIRYCIPIREGPSQATGDMNRKFNEIWPCGFWDMRADRQTDRHSDIQRCWSQYFAPLSEWNKLREVGQPFTYMGLHRQITRVFSSLFCSCCLIIANLVFVK